MPLPTFCSRALLRTTVTVAVSRLDTDEMTDETWLELLRGMIRSYSTCTVPEEEVDSLRPSTETLVILTTPSPGRLTTCSNVSWRLVLTPGSLANASGVLTERLRDPEIM
jgi:hypothetical protein